MGAEYTVVRAGYTHTCRRGYQIARSRQYTVHALDGNTRVLVLRGTDPGGFEVGVIRFCRAHPQAQLGGAPRGTALTSRTTASPKYEAVPNRARI